ncbi:MAG: glycosyltransferase [Spirochaetia bacterium]|nr:glycosyltransferase [Spirochaetia bacterium]MCF7953217.1 glycosyltransferase [Spirochaetales bacterium]
MSEDFIKRKYIDWSVKSAEKTDTPAEKKTDGTSEKAPEKAPEGPAVSEKSTAAENEPDLTEIREKKPITIVMRARNDMPLISETLSMLSCQTLPFELYAFDNSSNDGTRDELLKYAKEIIDVPIGKYVPGKVLNHAMRITEGDITVFLNSDCTPLDEFWLEELIQGFADPQVAAVFGRQMPREDCRPLYARDIQNTFGDGSNQINWRHCFSMASSAIRRSVWEEENFNEQIQYSEDIDWTWNARRRGYTIQYMQRSCVLHSHNYTWFQFYRRQYGEGKAEAEIFSWSPWEKHIIRYSFLPYLMQVKDDIVYALRRRYIGTALYAPVLRLAQLLGRRRGFKKGMRERKRRVKDFAF